MLLRLTLSLLAGAAADACAQTSTLLNDTFADGDRVTQNLPGSLAWYAPGAAAGAVSVRNNQLTLVANDNDRLVWGYFPAQPVNVRESPISTEAGGSRLKLKSTTRATEPLARGCGNGAGRPHATPRRRFSS